MKAVAYLQAGLPIDDPAALVDVDLPQPVPGPRDLLVKVHAVSVNPVDTKVRHRAQVTEPRVLGWDAVGTVEAVGEAVTLFKPGEVVYYAGSINRPGSNAEYQLVDERIVARKPASLDDAQAAALPLTAITAWELLFDRLRIPEGQGEGQVLLVTRPGCASWARTTSSTTASRWVRSCRRWASNRSSTWPASPTPAATTSSSSSCWRRRASLR
jgi:NADPH:quinone reductase-like Zn-dependent oxidoreductase